MFVRALSAVLLALASVGVSSTAAVADTSDFTFDSFDAQYYLTQEADGTSRLDVVETIVARFPDFDQNKGIIRAIPAVNQDIRLDPVVESVVDEAGNDVYFEEIDAGEFVELSLGTDEFVRGETTYVISYSLSNVVATFTEPEPVDEFYWDVNGTGWGQPFGRVSTTLRVDASIAPSMTGSSSCFAGALGEQNACELLSPGEAATGPTVFTTNVADLAPGETLTVAIGFDKGTFVQGEKVEGGTWDGELIDWDAPPLWFDILGFAFIGGSIAMLVVAIRKRIEISRGTARRGIIVPQYSVPKDLNPMVAATLVGRDSTAIAAQLVSLAVRKKLRILDYPVTNSGAEYTLQYLDSSDLDSFETQFMNAVFGGKLEVGEVRELSSGDVSLGRSINALVAKAKASQVSLGFRDPKRAMGCAPGALAFGYTLLTAVTGLVISVFTTSFSVVAVLATFVAFVIFIAIVALSIASAQGTLTPLGREKVDYLEGMKVYLELAEKDRFRMLQSPDGAERIDIGDTKQIVKLYEKLLPFAVIWGVEDEWIKELIVHSGEETPDWFQSTGGFSVATFSSALHGATSAAAYTPPTTWSGSGGSSSSSWSSGSGGSSGGGFSGGGGGGGGGGGR